MKTCSKCKKSKPTAEFHKDSARACGLQSACGACRAKYQKNPATRDQRLAVKRKYRQENADRIAADHRLKKYGLTAEQYDNLVARQRGMCAICLAPDKKLDVDHDHSTDIVRGLLCRRCNNAIGLIDESPWRLRRAASYVETWGRPV